MAFPHARIGGLGQPLIALGLTKMGITGVTTEKTVEYVFLSLSPLEKPEVQVQLLALAARTFQNRHLLQILQSASDAYEVYAAIQEWERSSSKPAVSDQNQQVKSGS